MSEKIIKKVVLEYEKIGNDHEWFLVVDMNDVQERGWLIGQKKVISEIISKLRNL